MAAPTPSASETTALPGTAPAPPPPLPAMPRRRRVWKLRHRLVLVVIAAIALAALVIGGVTLLVVRGLLTERVDEQLHAAASRPGISRSADPAQTDAPGFIGGPGLGPGALGAVITGDTLVLAGYLDTDARTVSLDAEQQRALLQGASVHEIVTVSLGDIGDYRVITETTTTGFVLIGLPLAQTNLTLAQLSQLIASLSAFVLIVAGIAGYLVVRAALRPLDRVAQTAAEVSRLDLAQGEVALQVRVPERDADERTEVGQVGAAINRMLGHVGDALTARQASEAKVRRFVSDASHELRTPLASIRGYSELVTRIGGDLPEDVVYSLGRIDSESMRMTGIVEDLLLLARLDEGRALASDPVDVTDLLIHAVNDAEVAGPDHPVSLTLPDAPVRVRGDAAKLQQVFVNLLANARVHTVAGTEIAVRLSLTDQGRTALIEVADSGAGIDPEVLPRIFERFVRADDSRTRATGSSGLGLAIVQGVVAAHRGTIGVRSEPGETVFSVRLPVLAG